MKSLSGLFADVASALIVLPEEPRRHAKAYGYDCAAQQGLRDAAGQAGRAIAGDGADDEEGGEGGGSLQRDGIEVGHDVV